ncbi:MAG: hypothetical protein WCO49_20040, partial [Nostocales cyanobacterium ELA608]
LSETLDVSGIVSYPNVVNVITECRDFGDQVNSVDETSGTTCKTYEAVKYAVLHYESKYVMRGADDTYVNLGSFFKAMPDLPSKRLYMGKLRRTHIIHEDLLLSHHPVIQERLGLYQFGQYMSGMGFVFSYDVAEFIASWNIPPHLLWCEDLMVGMWLNAFQITFMDHPGFLENYGHKQEGADYLMIHYMTNEQWDSIYASYQA